jgi:hypothetical protein
MDSPLGAMVGQDGDYFISALTTPTTGLLFSHISIIEDATISDVKIAGVSVKASRHYTGTLPAGYLMCAGKDKSFDYIKLQIKTNHNLALISFDDAYNYYYKFCNLKSLNFIVSKRYFEKYLYFKIADHIVYEKFIETEWAQ